MESILIPSELKLHMLKYKWKEDRKQNSVQIYRMCGSTFSWIDKATFNFLDIIDRNTKSQVCNNLHVQNYYLLKIS